MEALSNSELFSFIIYDTISATPHGCDASPEPAFLSENFPSRQECGGASEGRSSLTRRSRPAGTEVAEGRQNFAAQGRRKRKRTAKVCENKEAAETQRMTHIAVERNRRKQMNEHLAVLRSLMPESYVQRGDQASVVGGAIQFVKELEYLLQSLEAQKFLLLHGGRHRQTTTTAADTPILQQIFAYPQFESSQFPVKFTSKKEAEAAEIEVTLIETHANVRILTRRRLRQLSKVVAGFQALQLSVLHLNVTTLDPLVLYSISAKVEEACQFKSADEIAGGVHHILRIIEEETTLSSFSFNP